ncbi:MAG: hypothetical protein E6935_15170 [Clostridium butyricum]|nr:hypothetical protein [Clostridium butyricum]
MGLDSNSYTQGVREEMHWIPIKDIDKYRAYPSFLKKEIGNLQPGIKHVITHE